ncbi:hypothetical protein AAG570_012363 [Ranatra chinensis]|uniref:B30.2/SPRY domain-containing protein n=1 Tax=Ranatra chinensis TaxID=642074 RepID=A0ABD0YIK9_9HEMI
MGLCYCKCKDDQGSNRATNVGGSPNVNTISSEDVPDIYTPGANSVWWKTVSSKVIDNLILDTLKVIGSLVENDQEPPDELFKLHNIADQDEGWIQVVNSMVQVIPVEDPLGPAVITLLLDDCPLPNKEAVLRLSRMFNLSKKNIVTRGSNNRVQRNICIVLGVLAEKLSGPSSVAILNPGTLAFLIANLEDDIDPLVTLFSLIALEKFAQTSENKMTIVNELASAGNPLLKLETRLCSKDLVEAQVGFCAQWCLDNLFIIEGRPFSYENVDMTCINAMLNTKDVSEYLKISPDGLEARCDAYSFESVRCTFPVNEEIWYYEATLLSSGVMQIGWATRHSKFLNHEGYGIGDDEYSVAYDGCRELLWHNARSQSCPGGHWAAGDILGCLLNVPSQLMVFYINGKPVSQTDIMFKFAVSDIFAAASFMSFQQCRFNFGSKPFRFPPADIDFQCFNDRATLSPQERIVLPRHLQLEALKHMSIREDSCTICFDAKATVLLKPCGHK